MTIDELDTSECTCHLNSPCDFCTSLDEGEIDAFIDGGREGLADFIRARDAGPEAGEEVSAAIARDPGLSGPE